MNELLQEHGCGNVFKLPEGLKELMSDISREVLRAQPPKIYPFIASYLSALLLTREHGSLSLKILDELCDCKPTVSQHLMQTGFDRNEASVIADVIKEEIENSKGIDENASIKEVIILDKVLKRIVLDKPATETVCHITRNAFRDYWYRKQILDKELKIEPDQPWEQACQRTLELYKKTKPSFEELNRATERIQAAYKGYYVRKNMANANKPPKRKDRPKQELPGPPLDIASSREIDLGPVVDINVKDDNVNAMFEEDRKEKLGLHYSPMKTITHVEDLAEPGALRKSRQNLVRKSIIASDLSRRASEPPSARRKSRGVSISSQISLTENPNKISFADVSPEVIPDAGGYDDYAIPEDIADNSKLEPDKVEATTTVPDESTAPDVEAAETVAEPPVEDVSETPRTDGDGESAPESSAPNTARTDEDAQASATEDEG